MYQYRLKEIKVGDTEIKKGVKTTVSSIDPETGAITYDVENVADFTSTYQELEKAKDFLSKLEKTGKSKDDPAIDKLAAQIKELITSIDNTPRLKEFYNTKTNEIKTSLTELNKTVKDKATQIKIQEVVKILPTIDKTSKVKDDDLINLLQYYDLIEELKTTNVPVQA